MIDIEKKILEVFEDCAMTNPRIVEGIDAKGLMTIETDDILVSMDNIKGLEAELQLETYFSVKYVFIRDGVFFYKIYFDYELAACNVHCANYCSGTCPFRKKMECGIIRSKIEELKAYARVTHDKEV